MERYSFTSESVCAGHPDKLCDQISDAIVDAALAADPQARVAVEALAAKGHLVLAGEVTCAADIDFEEITRQQIRRLGYIEPAWGFWDGVPVSNFIHRQSPEIAQGVDTDGAGDQGIMFGYACRETPQLMPLPIMLAHELARQLDSLREDGQLPYLRPDGKTQVTVDYRQGQPAEVRNVVVAVPHGPDVALADVRHDVYRQAVLPALGKYGFTLAPKDLAVNGTGTWHTPGPASDAGLTGRKIVVDGYGGYARVGGGAFSGKDPTKVDRSGAYAARFIAKRLVSAGLADRAEVMLAYRIGYPQPVMKRIETFGTGRTSQRELVRFANSILDTSVKGILDGLNLRRPIYLQTASYGHFGKDGLPWE